MPVRHVIVGSGPAAVAAAESIRVTDPAAEIVVVFSDPHGYYSRPGLAYFLTGEVPLARLFPTALHDRAGLDARLVADRVVGIDRTAHRVSLQGGGDLPYDRLLLATGSRSLRPRVPGVELAGVFTLDDMDDALALAAAARRAKAAVVVGGGITAIEIVEGLRAQGVHVHYFLRRERYWNNVLSENEARIVEQRLLHEGVEIHRFTELAAILGRDGRVAGVETADGARLPCDIVAMAIGVRPQTALARESGLACERGVLVDARLRTSDPDIYAAGDIAEVCPDPACHLALEVLWNPAVIKGRIAGHNMAGGPARTYEEGSPLNVTRLAGLRTTIIGTVGSGEDDDLEGIARGDSQIWSELCDEAIVEAERGDAHVRLALGAAHIVGAVVMGDQALSFPLQELIEGRADVSAVIPALEAPEAPIVELINGAWRDWTERRA